MMDWTSFLRRSSMRSILNLRRSALQFQLEAFACGLPRQSTDEGAK
jgi:hypothetical protein